MSIWEGVLFMFVELMRYFQTVEYKKPIGQ